MRKADAIVVVTLLFFFISCEPRNQRIIAGKYLSPLGLTLEFLNDGKSAVINNVLTEYKWLDETHMALNYKEFLKETTVATCEIPNPPTKITCAIPFFGTVVYERARQ